MSYVPQDGAPGLPTPSGTATTPMTSSAGVRPRRPALIGILAMAAMASVVVLHFAPFVMPLLATAAAIVLGLISVIGGYGRWWGIGALVLASALVVLTAAFAVGGFSFNPRQQSMLDRASAIEPPAGFALRQGPIGVGWCGYVQITCDEAEVLWSYTPVGESTEPSDLCAAYLHWAGAQGVDTVFLASEAEWRSWIDFEILSQREKGGPNSFGVDSAAALDACVDLVMHPRADADGLDKAMNLIGVQHAPGSYAEVFVARITEPKSIPDGSPDDSSSSPFMIMGGLHTSE